MEQQDRLINKYTNNLPKNLIIIGQKYSGKKTLARLLAPEFIEIEGKVDNIRELEQGNFLFLDIDDWSNASYSAMLNLLEENSGKCILTCKNILNIPNSIKSRCVIDYIDAYQNIDNYCDNIGQLQLYSDEMLDYIDKFEYKEDFDLDVYFSVACNYLREKLKTEDIAKEYLITCKYNAHKSLKALNKKQFIINWQLDLKGVNTTYLTLTL